MAQRGFTEHDWKLFRSKIVGWQEDCMGRLIREYIELLNRETDPSDRFWELDKRMRADKKKAGVRLQMSRSEMIYHIVTLIEEGTITMNELEDFSEQLRETVQFIVESH